jgi:hypothetical protein
MNREEIDKEVEEEFAKYMKTKKKPVEKESRIDWYKFLSVFIMAIGILSTVYFLVRMLTTK